jgi:hypothetical protein
MEESAAPRVSLSPAGNAWWGAAAFVSPLALYLFTLAPTYLWSDSAKLALFVHERQFAASGFEAHAMHAVLGYLFSLLPLSLAASQNLMSAVFAAGAVFLAFCILRTGVGGPGSSVPAPAAFLASGSLAVSHLFWHYAVINESYAPLTFFLASGLFLAQKWRGSREPKWLFLLALSSGMGFSMHGMTALFAPGLLVLLWNDEFGRFAASWRALVAAALFFVGAAPSFLLPLFGGASAAEVIGAFTGSLSGHYKMYSLGLGHWIKQLALHPFYLLYQFPTAGLPLAVWGLKGTWRSRFSAATALLWAATVLFAAKYFLQRQFAMLIPSFFIVSLWLGVGLGRYWRPGEWRKWAVLFLLLCVAPPFFYHGVYRLCRARGFHLSFVRTLPCRDTERYFLVPGKGRETGARDYAESCFRQAAPNSVILCDFNPGMALVYAQEVLGARKDVEIVMAVDDWVHKSPDPGEEVLKYLRRRVKEEKRTVYLADVWEAYYFASRVRREFTLDPEGGSLWRVKEI